MKLFAAILLLAACTAQPHYPLQVRQTLLHGSDAAIIAGCERGVLRWHYFLTGSYPPLADVSILCEGVRRSFADDMGQDLGKT